MQRLILIELSVDDAVFIDVAVGLERRTEHVVSLPQQISPVVRRCSVS